MVQRVLVQTDFQPESLESLSVYLHFRKNDKVELVFVHGIIISDSIMDLLFFNSDEWLKDMKTNRFLERLSELQSCFRETIADVQFELFTGASFASFQEFVEERKINRLLIPYGYKFNWKVKNWRDLSTYFERLDIARHEISIDIQSALHPSFSAQ